MKYTMFTFILLTIFLTSCSTNNSPTGTVIAKEIQITYLNEQGEDLVNPARTNPISDQNTAMYYVINGKATKYFDGMMDNPDGISVIPPDRSPSEYYTLLFLPNTIEEQNQAITYIRFADGSYDTLKVQYKNSLNSDFHGTLVTKVWYNHKLQVSPGERRYFIVRKSEEHK